jgi:hypothetical protein
MIDIKYQLKLSFIKHPIRNKLKGFPGLSLVDNYQHLIKLKGFPGLSLVDNYQHLIKLKGFPGLSFVDNYQHLIKGHENSI